LRHWFLIAVWLSLILGLFLCVRADEKDDMASVDSDKFRSIINKVENLHQHGKDYHPLSLARLRFLRVLGGDFVPCSFGRH
jgi:hypothetical protein